MCAQHSQEIFDYMAYLETKWPLQPKFLRLQTAVSPEMRAILINWMMMVHQRFQLLQETLFLAVSLTDRFVQADIVEHNVVKLVLLPCLLDYPMAWVRPSEQAAAAVCLSLRLFDREDQHMWGALMSHLGCYTEEALQPTIKIMAGLLLDAAKSGHKAPYEKYKHSRMERVCTVIVAHAAKLREMAVRP
ncbi:G2/mitotic-specific cyclin-B2 [Dermacentor silvarum]|uniref:G2/mitotic-specific cyclin-B2 n=1 Tax=Dermacentor silvarum TaxID=543639 RepID=UPI00210152F3|nr:G2/mitotic-specific cyclin-B2 [Dermacentor silvarum]